jgi:hypothetical protein
MTGKLTRFFNHSSTPHVFETRNFHQSQRWLCELGFM